MVSQEESSRIRATARSYFNVRPLNVQTAVRLYLGYITAILARLISRSNFKSTGFYIPGKKYVTVSLNGISIIIRPKTNDLSIVTAAMTEPKTAAWFKVQPRETVVDIGAHIGRYTLIAAKNRCKVISVEPEPSNFSVLKMNVKLNRFSNVLLLPLALGKTQGTLDLTLLDPHNLGGWSIAPECPQVEQAGRYVRRVKVECKTLDRIISELGLRTIDWLKIDVEGHEVDVLEGGKNALRVTRNVILEVARRNEKECEELVEECGLELVAVEKVGGPITNWFLTRRSLESPMKGGP